MATIKEIVKFIEEIAPLEKQAEWDNSGMQLCGDPNKDVKKACVALDCDHSIIGKLDCELLIAHHPLIIFKGPMSIQGTLFNVVEYLMKNNISVYSCHTSLDRTLMNGAIIAEAFKGLQYKHVETETIGDVIELEEEMEFDGFLGKIMITVDRYLPTQKVKRIGVVGGAGFNPEYVKELKDINVDVIVSGDLKHHEAQNIDAQGMGAVDISHVAEMIGMIKLSEKLQEKFPEVEFRLVSPTKYWQNI